MYTSSLAYGEMADGEIVQCVKAAELEFKNAVHVAAGTIKVTRVTDEVMEGNFVLGGDKERPAGVNLLMGKLMCGIEGGEADVIVSLGSTKKI